MNPLSPFTYYRRHQRQTLLLVGLIALMTLGIGLVVGMLDLIMSHLAAIALAALNTIFVNQRQEEFGVLNALGISRRWLMLRTTRETTVVVAIAWLLGAALCGISLIVAQVTLYSPIGISLKLGNLQPWLLTLPLPAAVILASAAAVTRMLSKLDPVLIIERR